VPTAHKLRLRTLGHASAVLYRNGENPLLTTDPWLVGSVYWRSWWLQNYPTAEEIDWLAQSASIYITHEHSDHFHMRTIRRLGHAPAYLFPAMAERGYLDHMRQRGYRAETLAPLRWHAIASASAASDTTHCGAACAMPRRRAAGAAISLSASPS
jgi:L-ascorbate metabolism protein UlaG (beta-lactamase superfamily)